MKRMLAILSVVLLFPWALLSVQDTAVKLSEADPLVEQVRNVARQTSLLPTGWDAALAGDEMMRRLVKGTAVKVKGAHDAEFVCVGERGYIVEHDNDVALGHGAGAAMYRDFDLRTQSFDENIHKAKLKTAAGIFDMQPRHFHADAAAQGFTKPPINHGLYIFDSFKEFDGRNYVALNNFPGKQNALAVLHDDFVTFEIIAHYKEPQSQQLSESAINRLPDGSWMAICRNDGGNYHFTTSRDGNAWIVGETKPFVPNCTLVLYGRSNARCWLVPAVLGGL